MAGSRGGSTATRVRSSPGGSAPSADEIADRGQHKPAQIVENIGHVLV